ncbi:serine-rich adhesin for platelets-like isoform X2 [Branchiostoma lanceolatum]|uniref:serine-rich adhesin for platelets-like isoform X2 n=1 Tax=Branchiostoma lanceolatum TaxID=7740 RepID=UPI00345546CD
MDVEGGQNGKQKEGLGPRSFSMNSLRRSMRGLLKGGKKKKANKKLSEKQTTDSREIEKAQQSHRDSIDLSTLPNQGQSLSRSMELLERQSSLQIKQSRHSNERLIQEYRDSSNVIQMQSLQGQVTHVNDEAQYLRNGTELKHTAQDSEKLTVDNPNATEVSVISTFQIHVGEGSQTKRPGSSHFRNDRLDSGVEILSSDTERTPSLYVSDGVSAARSLRSRWTNDWVVQTSDDNNIHQEPASHLVLQPIRIELQSRPISGEQVNRMGDPGVDVRSESADPLLSGASRLRQPRSDDESGRGRSQSVGTLPERSVRSQRTNDWVRQLDGRHEGKGPAHNKRLPPVHIQRQLQRCNLEPGSQRTAPATGLRSSSEPNKHRDDTNKHRDDTYDRFETFVQSLDRLHSDSDDSENMPMTMDYWLKNCAWSRYAYVEGFWRYPRYRRDYQWDAAANKLSRGRKSRSAGPMTSLDNERGRGYRQVTPSSRHASSDAESNRGKRQDSADHVRSHNGHVWEIPTYDYYENRHQGKENGHFSSRNQRERSSQRSVRSERSNLEDRTRTRRKNNRRTHGRNQRRGNAHDNATSDGRSRSRERDKEKGTSEEKIKGDVFRDSSGIQRKQRAPLTANRGRGQTIEANVEEDVAGYGTQSKHRAPLTSNTRQKIERSVSKDSSGTQSKQRASLTSNTRQKTEVGGSKDRSGTQRNTHVSSTTASRGPGQKVEREVSKGSSKGTTGTTETLEGAKGSIKGSLSQALFGALIAEERMEDTKTPDQPGGKDGAEEKTTQSPGLGGFFKGSFFGSKSDGKDKDGGLDTDGKKADREQTGKEDTKAKEESGFASVFKRPFFKSKTADQDDSGGLVMHSIKATGKAYYDIPEEEEEESGSFSFMKMIRRRSPSASSLDSCSSDDERKPRRPVATGGRKKTDEEPESAGVFGNAMHSFKGLFGDDGKSVAEKESEHTIMATGRGKLAKKEAEHNIMATQGSVLSRKEAEHSIAATWGSDLAKKEAEFGIMAGQAKTLAEKEAEYSMMASMGKGQKQSESSGVFGGLFGGLFGGDDGKSQAEKEAEHSIMASRGEGHDSESTTFLSGLFGRNSAPADRKNHGGQDGHGDSILGVLGLDDSSTSCSSSSSDDEEGIMTSLFSAVGMGGNDTGRKKHGHKRQKPDAMKSAWAKRDTGGGAKKGGESSVLGFLGFGGDSDGRRHSHRHGRGHKGREPKTPTTPQLPSVFSAFQPQ